MAVRKSKYIGQTIGHHEILDSKHAGTCTKFLTRCTICGNEHWYSNSSVVKNNTPCVACQSGKIYHNAKGCRNERLYERYISIIRRLKSSEHYKKLKITMCDEWLEDYTAFRDWSIENGYAEGLYIDRIDNSKGYSPDNCRWIDAKGQARNKTNNILITYNGKTQPAAAWDEELGRLQGFTARRKRSGLTDVECIEKPYKYRK